jgi:hypothetical protein
MANPFIIIPSPTTWYNNVNFTNTNLSYVASNTGASFIFVTVDNTVGLSNCIITLPSIAAPAKGYSIKMTSNIAANVYVTTDNTSLSLVDGSVGVSLNTIAHGSLSPIMGPDGNYWSF